MASVAILFSESQTLIPFDQVADIINRLHPQQHQILIRIKEKYSGLCENICNFVLMKNLLGQGIERNYLRERITAAHLNQRSVADSHILKVYSVFHQVLAWALAIYPDNLLSCTDQWQLVKWGSGAIDRAILCRGLDPLSNGETLKMEIIRKKCFGIRGHSLLLKKIARRDFILFDPNWGEVRNVDLDELIQRIEGYMTKFQGSDLFLLPGKNYLGRLRNNGIERGECVNFPICHKIPSML